MIKPIIFQEYDKSVFSHYFGSKLYGLSSDTSDSDILDVYTTKYIIHKTRFDKIWMNMTSFDKEKNIETYSLTGTTIVDLLVDPKLNKTSEIIKIIQHLACIKYGNMIQINDQQLFDDYKEWLNSPGLSCTWWQDCVKNAMFQYINALPDRENNWSQNFDGSDHQTAMRDYWHYSTDVYPEVNIDAGYDIKQAYVVFSVCFLIKNILRNSDVILSESQKDILKSVKSGTLPFDTYKALKPKIWRDARKAIESLAHLYFLGVGDSIQESKSKGTFGFEGIANIIKKFQTSIVIDDAFKSDWNDLYKGA